MSRSKTYAWCHLNYPDRQSNMGDISRHITQNQILIATASRPHETGFERRGGGPRPFGSSGRGFSILGNRTYVLPRRDTFH